MSIATDIRSYADSAVTQGKQVLGQAHAQFNEVTGKARENVSEIADKAGSTVTELRVSAEHAIKAAVEPYLAQAKDYRSTVSERAETLFATAKKDERVARFVDTAGTVTGMVVETVQEHFVKPVQSLTGRGGKPAAPATAANRSASDAAKPAGAQAATKPAGKQAPTKPATTRSAAARATASAKPAATTKPATKASPRKAPARKTTES